MAAWLDKCDSKIIYERRMQSQVLYVVPITSILGGWLWCLWVKLEPSRSSCAMRDQTFLAQPATRRKPVETAIDGGTSIVLPSSGPPASSSKWIAREYGWALRITDSYELCRTRNGIFSQFLHPESQIEPIEKREPIKSNGKSSWYLFEYELRMLLGVFSTCWAKKYERSEGWI